MDLETFVAVFSQMLITQLYNRMLESVKTIRDKTEENNQVDWNMVFYGTLNALKT